MSANAIATLLADGKTIILDGALATELEGRGYDLSDALWSCRALMQQPELIYQVHRDYFESGADVAITASYQASIQGLQEYSDLDESQASDLIIKSVHLAQQARHDTKKEGLLIAGSVGPYGAYLADGSEYRGDYKVSDQRLEDFHRPRIAALVQGGVDVLACETMPSFEEVRVLQKLLRIEFPEACAWFSFTLKDAQHLSDGTPLAKICESLQSNEQIVALGFNCIPHNLTLNALTHISQFTSLPLVAYPNSGEVWNAQTRTWTGDGADGKDLQGCVKEWKAAGARLIGGCCRTGPAHVRLIAEMDIDRSGP